MKPIFGYMGGKTKLAPQILPFIPAHKIYVEPFFGSGALFFEKGYPDVSSKDDYREVIGDLDGNVTNFFEQLRTRGAEMEERLKLYEYSEENHKRCKTKSETFKSADDFERACMYFFNVCNSFGCVVDRGFAYGKYSKNPCQTWKTKRKKLHEYIDRLTDCYIFNKPYDVLIDRFDTPDTFFYFDPPYMNTTGYSVTKDSPFDYAKFVEKVKKTKGKWIISHYRDEWLESSFDGYRIVDLKHSASSTKAVKGCERVGKDVKECIVMNYEDANLFEGLDGG